jgi:hypothetical protein
VDRHAEAVAALAGYFRRDGYVRGPIPERMLLEGWSHYKKGWEARISCPDDPAEIREMEQLLDAAGWSLTRWFRKHGRVIFPIYGRERVKELIEAGGMEMPDT